MGTGLQECRADAGHKSTAPPTRCFLLVSGSEKGDHRDRGRYPLPLSGLAVRRPGWLPLAMARMLEQVAPEPFRVIGAEATRAQVDPWIAS